MQSPTDWLNTPAGKITGWAVVSALVLTCGLLLWRTLGAGPAATESAERMFIDAQTGKPFEHAVRPGETIPIESPSGTRSGYPAEACYWTADGKPKDIPTYVLLNTYTGNRAPTFCPDCGRLVVGHNPRPHPAAKPPPTKAEYESSPRMRNRN